MCWNAWRSTRSCIRFDTAPGLCCPEPILSSRTFLGSGVNAKGAKRSFGEGRYQTEFGNEGNRPAFGASGWKGVRLESLTYAPAPTRIWPGEDIFSSFHRKTKSDNYLHPRPATSPGHCGRFGHDEGILATTKRSFAESRSQAGACGTRRKAQASATFFKPELVERQELSELPALGTGGNGENRVILFSVFSVSFC